MAQTKTVRALYDAAPLEHRKTLLEMRMRIMQVVPEAEEVISYGMPAFKVNGNIVAGIMAAKNHVGYYPFSGSIIHLFPTELARYKRTKSAIHVPVGKPLSKTLISKLIKARISQCPVKQGLVNTSRYEKLDSFWRELGIAAPARRGLVDNKILKIGDLRKITKNQFLEIHAIGPRAAAIILAEMKRKKVEFRPERSR